MIVRSTRRRWWRCRLGAGGGGGGGGAGGGGGRWWRRWSGSCASSTPVRCKAERHPPADERLPLVRSILFAAMAHLCPPTPQAALIIAAGSGHPRQSVERLSADATYLFFHAPPENEKFRQKGLPCQGKHGNFVHFHVPAGLLGVTERITQHLVPGPKYGRFDMLGPLDTVSSLIRPENQFQIYIQWRKQMSTKT
jgi:hypothetical protein